MLAVLLFHAEEEFFPLGYLGVDLFFVISGYVVTPLILRVFTGPSDGLVSRLKDFYERRFYRLAPALASTLVLFAFIIFIIGSISDHQRFARQGISTLLVVGNLGAYRYAGNYFTPNPNPLIHTWSLSVEEQIYILLPLFLIIFLLKSKDIKRSAVSVYCSIMVLSFIFFLFPEILNPLYEKFGIYDLSKFSFYSPLGRVWQFMLGGIGYLLVTSFRLQVQKFSWILNLTLSLSLVLLLFTPITISQKNGTIAISFIALLAISLRSLNVLPQFISKCFEWLGDRSYSIYLAHMPLLYIVHYSPVFIIHKGLSESTKTCLAVFASIVLGAFSHSQIEERFRKRSETQKRTISTIAITLIVTLLIPLTLFVSIDRFAAKGNQTQGPDVPVPSGVAPWDWDSSCQFHSVLFHVKTRPCVYGSQNRNGSILLIGDSHAAADSRAIISLANDNKMKTYVFTFQGCGFILNPKELTPSYEYPFLTDDCLKHNQRILDFVRTEKPTVIIWGHRSSSIMVSPNNLDSRTEYNNLLLSSLLELRELNKNIIIIGSENEYIPADSILQKVFNLKGRYSDIPFEDNRYWTSATSDTFYYLDTLQIFCPSGLCRNRSGDIWLFHDEDHLSLAGSRLLLPKLDYFIRIILKSQV